MTQTKDKIVIFVANRGYALLSSRKRLIERLIHNGFKVVIATADDIESRELCRLGAILEPVTFYRGGLNVFNDLKAFVRLYQIYRKWQPVLIHHFHAKPVIFGSIAAKMTPVKDMSIVNTITGLGSAFIKGGGIKVLAGWGYSIALPKNTFTIFQNHDDYNLFLEQQWVAAPHSTVIAGSGVDVEYFSVSEEGGDSRRPPVVLLLARLLNQKGIPEFVEIAKNVREKILDAQFLIAGEVDEEHPDAVQLDWLNSQKDIEYLGRLQDVREVLRNSDILLFPSYREGVPRAVLESSAMSVPAIGFDVPGVREAIKDGETGFLYKFKDTEGMTCGVLELLNDAALRLEMGKAARKFVTEDFDIRSIEQKYIDVYSNQNLEIT